MFTLPCREIVLSTGLERAQSPWTWDYWRGVRLFCVRLGGTGRIIGDCTERGSRGDFHPHFVFGQKKLQALERIDDLLHVLLFFLTSLAKPHLAALPTVVITSWFQLASIVLIFIRDQNLFSFVSKVYHFSVNWGASMSPIGQMFAATAQRDEKLWKGGLRVELCHKNSKVSRIDVKISWKKSLFRLPKTIEDTKKRVRDHGQEC